MLDVAGSPREEAQPTKILGLIKQLCLNFVNTSVHDHKKQKLCLSGAVGQTFYSHLCPTSEAWERQRILEKLIYLWDHKWRVTGVWRPSQLCIQQTYPSGWQW